MPYPASLTNFLLRTPMHSSCTSTPSRRKFVSDAGYTAAPSCLPRLRMCLILLAYRVLPGVPLIVAANRDEFYGRPTQSAHFWPDAPDLLAGRDARAGGTWLGIDRKGRFAAVTNFAVTGLEDPSLSEPGAAMSGAPQVATERGEAAPLQSRGALPAGFLRGGASAAEYARRLHGADYQGFNLLLWDGEQLVCTSNRGATRVLGRGYHGLTNAEWGVTWPKVVDGMCRLRRVVEDGPTADALIEMLRDDTVPPDERLPHRGRPLDRERRGALSRGAPGDTPRNEESPCFILGEDYGTRASTAVICASDRITLSEQGYGAKGRTLERVDYRITPA